jgi:hypothetical protein
MPIILEYGRFKVWEYNFEKFCWSDIYESLSYQKFRNFQKKNLKFHTVYKFDQIFT